MSRSASILGENREYAQKDWFQVVWGLDYLQRCEQDQGKSTPGLATTGGHYTPKRTMARSCWNLERSVGLGRNCLAPLWSHSPYGESHGNKRTGLSLFPPTCLLQCLLLDELNRKPKVKEVYLMQSLIISLPRCTAGWKRVANASGGADERHSAAVEDLSRWQ